MLLTNQTSCVLKVLLAIVVNVSSLFAQPQARLSDNSASFYLEKQKEVYFSFTKPEPATLESLVTIISIDQISEDVVYAYANPKEYRVFLEMDIPYQVLQPPGMVDFDLNMISREEIQQRDLTETWDFYPTYEAYVALMYQFEQDYPDLVEIVNIGETVLGRDLLFARISPDADQPGPVPQFMYTSTMHGDETAGFILSLRLIHYLLTNYGVDEDITNLMRQVEIWICPNENPDGTYRYDNSTVSGATRGNINGVDLNRNYPNPVNDPWQTQQPETTAMINFTDTMNFIMSANMHGGIELVNFPFDSWTSGQNKHADHDWWEFVMYEYVDTVHANSPSGYMTGMGDGVTHGGDWYVIYGSRQDYFNYYKSCREFTLELSNQKLLDPLLLPAHWEYNYRSLINYIRQATYGVQGIVYDNTTGEPLLAEILIPGHDSNNSQVFTANAGNYSRPLLQGSYDLQFSAEGYSPVTIPGADVVNHQAKRLNVALGEGVQSDIALVSIGTEGGGEVFPFTGSEYFNVGATVFLSAVADESWQFEEWQVDGSHYSGEQETSLAVDGETQIQAVFVEDTYSDFPGDANGDGVVDILDVIATVAYFAGEDPDPFYFMNADINQDGIIDLLDVILIVDIIASGD